MMRLLKSMTQELTVLVLQYVFDLLAAFTFCGASLFCKTNEKSCVVTDKIMRH